MVGKQSSILSSIMRIITLTFKTTSKMDPITGIDGQCIIQTATSWAGETVLRNLNGTMLIRVQLEIAISFKHWLELLKDQI